VVVVVFVVLLVAAFLVIGWRADWWRAQNEAPPETPAITDTATSELSPTPDGEGPALTPTDEAIPDPAIPANPLNTAPAPSQGEDSAGVIGTAALAAGIELSGEPPDSPTPDATAPPSAGATATPSPSPTPPPTPTPTPLPLDGVRIGIDPGHQIKANREQEPIAPDSKETKDKVSSGTAGVKTRVAEYVVNLDVSFLLRDALVALGAEVFLTREVHEVDISNIERATMMNEHEVDLVLRIHCNGSTNRSAQGIGLYIRKTGEGAAECLRAAEALLPAMVAATGAKSTGIHKSDTYTGLNWSTVPSILVEMGYMSNPEEDERLNNLKYQELLVHGMVQGIADFMGRSLDGEPLTE